MRHLWFSLVFCLFLQGSARSAPVPDLEILFLDAAMWDKPVGEVLRDRKPLGFHWLSKERNDARSNQRGLKLWNLPVGETILRSRDDKLHSFDISIYNRGDNGEMEQEQFKDLTEKWHGLLMEKTSLEGEKMNRSQKGSVVSADRWVWKCPGAFLVLTSSKSRASRGYTPEFLKLSLVSVKYGKEIYEQRSGLTRSMARRRDLIANRVIASNGDVFVQGVPMVDQGRKGYCAVASAERVFRYYGLPVDQHAMAQIAESSAQGGTNPANMIAALKKVAGRTKTRILVHYELEGRKIRSEMKAYNRLIRKNKEGKEFREGVGIPYQYFLSNCHGPTLREVRAKGTAFDRFKNQIRDNIDTGTPLLWALQVGVFPERGIPQQGGGHMRLVIGYNPQTDEIIYTDSWGPGHEFKRMSAANAYTATMHLITLKPSQ
ncbi:MAG: hypothetical protein CMN02_14100 [Roseibacillus sp.]|nr:hypothetical protein [Roseibacillus sp.]